VQAKVLHAKTISCSLTVYACRHSHLAASQPDITSHTLPSEGELDCMLQGLPLQKVEFIDEQDLYLALLQVHRNRPEF